MKKINLLIAAGAALASMGSLVSCGPSADVTITVYNAEDYIYEATDDDGNQIDGEKSTIEGFQDWYYEQTGKTIEVNYQTFSTIEEMYTKIKQGTIKADLVCPSDYMIQKMQREGMLESFGYDSTTDKYGEDLQNVNDNLSPYIKDLFKKNSFSDYAVPYFWGTMGYTYDPSKVDTDKINSWEFQWNPVAQDGTSLANMISVKDSVRDTYFTAVMHVYHDELMTLKNKFDVGTLTATEYNAKLSEIFNKVDSETLTKAKDALLDLKKKAILEVDEGKSDVAKGILVSNLAWSGDSVYAMDTAEESGLYLNYTIPQEGSNVWFDGWCMPKGSNVEASKAFVNYLSLPEVASKNMETTGYTSPLACDAIWNLVNDLYAAEESEAEVDEVDLSYFFGEDHKIRVLTEERGRQFDAQYPDENTIARCAVMKDFGDEANEALYSIWGIFKSGK